MLAKPTILYVIDDLTRGGAETLLVGILRDIQIDYNVVLVTLRDKCDFDESRLADVKRYSLNVGHPITYFAAVIKLKYIIKKHTPQLVHAHLLMSSIVGRFACPGSVPLVFSVHSELSKNAFKESKLLLMLEKFSIRCNQTLVAVSNTVLEDYKKFVHFKGKQNVIENYIDDDFFSRTIPQRDLSVVSSLKMVALGNIKKAKNYKYLVESFKLLKGLPVTLDIYGKTDHPLYNDLQQQITAHNLPIQFKGRITDIPQAFALYNLYVMSSEHEGFGLAAVEAMASGLPVMLSDVPVLHEVTNGRAIFFSLADPGSLAGKIKSILNNEIDLVQYAREGISVAAQYTKSKHLANLKKLYAELTQRSSDPNNL